MENTKLFVDANDSGDQMEFKNNSFSQNADKDAEIRNIYAEIEPVDVPGIDFASGADLIPMSKELVKCETALSSFGLFSDYDRNKVEAKVLEMKETFLNAAKTTPHASLFSTSDEWLAKGSAMEGNLFAALHELSEDQFVDKVLGTDPQKSSMDVLLETLSNFKAMENNLRYFIQLADIDIMVSPECIRLTDEKCLLRTKYPNYYSIEFDGVQKCESLSDKSESIDIDGNERKSLCPFKLRDAFEVALQAMCVYHENNQSAMVCAPHGLAFQVVKIKLSNGLVMGHFYDIAFSVKCSFWPQCCESWLDRHRVWPDKDGVKQIIDGGVHLVAKSPTTELDDLLWRFTFAKAEGMITELPLVYWYTLRSWSLVKSFLQDFNTYNKPEIITSYHIKTLFLHAMERLPIDYWISGENTVKTIVSIIDELIACLATQECPHYFIPEINLFERSGKLSSVEVFSTVARQLRRARHTLIQDPVEYFFRGGHAILDADAECTEQSEDAITPT